MTRPFCHRPDARVDERRYGVPTEDGPLILLFRPVVSGQIKLRKIDGHAKMAAVISKRRRPAA
jgi:hypothetical protein